MKEATSRRNIALDYILRFVGLPYRWGGDDPLEGFDCSGLAIEYGKAGDALPGSGDWTAKGLFDRFSKAGRVSKTPAKGRLVFFGTPENIYHVEICLSKKLSIGAGGGTRDTVTFSDAVVKNAYIKIRPFHARRDIAGFADIF